jgi:hypothetical protein
VSTPGDAFEQQADRIAEQVMRQPAAVMDAGPAPDKHAAALHTGDNLFGAPGQLLDPSTRRFFEPRFGRDFAGVRVYTDIEAAESARALKALAYTAGSNIVFASGQYAPASARGRRLLAHELAHVAQNDAAAAPATIRRKEDWDFTPADYAALKKGQGDLKIAADSSWVPTGLQSNILNTLRYTLDPKRSPAATEGVNVEDFYHGHLVVPNNDKGLSIDAIEARSKFQKELKSRTTKALGGEFENVTAKKLGAYTKGIEASLPLLGKAMEEVMKIKGAAVVYHTYEVTAAAKGIKPHDPRRNYITPFDTNTPKPYKLPKGANDYTDEYVHYLEFTFLVDQNGEVHVRPGGRDPLSTIIGAPVTGP